MSSRIQDPARAALRAARREMRRLATDAWQGELVIDIEPAPLAVRRPCRRCGATGSTGHFIMGGVCFSCEGTRFETVNGKGHAAWEARRRRLSAVARMARIEKAAAAIKALAAETGAQEEADFYLDDLRRRWANFRKEA